MLNTSANLNELVDSLNKIGLEVSSLKTYKTDVNKLKVAKIIDVKKHPNADKLNVCTIQFDEAQTQVVCGAPNVNVNKKYDWDNLTINEIEELIEDKKQKEIEKVVHNWEEEGIRVEKGRWGKFYLIKSKKKILLDKNLDVHAMTIGQAKEIYKANSSNKSKK